MRSGTMRSGPAGVQPLAPRFRAVRHNNDYRGRKPGVRESGRRARPRPPVGGHLL